jgi:hypothetical protein
VYEHELGGLCRNLLCYIFCRHALGKVFVVTLRATRVSLDHLALGKSTAFSIPLIYMNDNCYFPTKKLSSLFKCRLDDRA